MSPSLIYQHGERRMIKAVIFDLDGTLVRTEELKALSYARAAMLWKSDVTEEAVVNAYKEVVGLSRQEVSEYVLRSFHLEDAARKRMQKDDGGEPWKALAREHVANYIGMIETPGLLDKYKCPYNAGLLDYVKRGGFRVGLATLSHRPETEKILEILGLRGMFDVIATREDVEKGKPDPGVYLLVAHQLGVTPQESLVIEDSVNGIRAALAAGMACIAVTSNITRQSVHESGLVAKQWIVDEPAFLMTVARQVIAGERPGSLSTQQSSTDPHRALAQR